MSGCAKFLSPFRNRNQRCLDKNPLWQSLFRNAGKFFLFSFLILPLLYRPAYAQSDAISDRPIQLVMPKEGCMNVDKKVTIKCTIQKPFDPKGLVVLLNGKNLSRMIDVKPDGFEYTGTSLLSPGNHTLSVTVTTFDGRELKQEFEFSACPSKIAVDETNSGQEGTVSTVATPPDSKGERILINESKLRKKEWESPFKTNSRLYNPNMPATPTGNRFNVTTSSDRNLNALGPLSLFSDMLRLKALYTRADEWATSSEALNPTGNPSIPSFGSSLGGDGRGDVFGILLTSDLWGNKLVAEAEVNLSGLNSDTLSLYPTSPNRDVFSPPLFRRDNTYRLKLRGAWGNYSYEALYEYLSFDDHTFGTQGMSDAMQRYMFKVGGKFFQVHYLNLSFSQYMDNVKGNSLYPTLNTTQVAIDYSFTKFESLPITLSYQRSMARTKDEPSGNLGTKINMDTVTGNMNYLKGPWNIGLQVSYSIQNDLTAAKNNNTTLTCTFLPIYTLNHVSIAPGFSFGHSASHGVNINTFTASLDLQGDLFSKKFTYGLGGAYTRLTTSDNSSRQDILSANFNLFYSLSGQHWGFLNPSIGIMGLYSRTNDRNFLQTTNGYEFFLMFQAKFSSIF